MDFESKVYVYENEKWEECAWGRVAVEFERPSNDVDAGEVSLQQASYNRQFVADNFKYYNVPYPIDKLYRVLRESGAQYGPAFQTLGNVKYSSSRQISSANVSLSSWIEKGGGELA